MFNNNHLIRNRVDKISSQNLKAVLLFKLIFDRFHTCLFKKGSYEPQVKYN